MQGGLGLNEFGIVGKGVNGLAAGSKETVQKSRLDSKNILIDQSKNEIFSPSKGLKVIHRWSSI